MNQYEGRHSKEVEQKSKQIQRMSLFIAFLLGAVCMGLAVVIFR